ncbi:MAG: ABC transporter permease [Candidatus Chisholmbacteria bacterium]|nr:ABC transporter permease [Candidatus Chisholmbacteria bacterium]
MPLVMLLNTAWESLRRRKSRSLLTTLGVVVGVAAVIVLVSVGQGLEAMMTKEFRGIGSNLVFVVPGDVVDERGNLAGGFVAGPTAVTGKSFTERDVREVARLSPVIRSAIPLTEKRLRVRSKYKQRRAATVGTVANYAQAYGITMQEGRFFNEGEAGRASKVVVLGSKMAEELFPNGEALGKTVSVSVVTFKVMGVINPRGAEGSIGGASLDEHIYIPAASLQQLIGTSGFEIISVQITDENHIEEAVAELKAYFLRHRKPDSFSVIDQRKILGTLQKLLSATTYALSGIAAISLLVGGIGIMNMMLVSVTERTREIGLRKAVGATPGIILAQFLTEAVVLAGIGGLVGIFLGSMGSLVVGHFLPTRISVWAVVVAFGVSAGVGVVFGVFPARRAAKLSPIEALRYE